MPEAVESWFRTYRYHVDPTSYHRKYKAEVICGNIARRDLVSQGLTEESVQEAVEQRRELHFLEEGWDFRPARTVSYLFLPEGPQEALRSCECQDCRLYRRRNRRRLEEQPLEEQLQEMYRRGFEDGKMQQ